MEIGRKIYFNKLAGEVVQDIGERMGDVRETTKEEDFADYPQLTGKDPSTIDFIQLSYGERSAEFANMGSMHVDPTTKVLTIYPRLTIATDKVQIVSDGVDTATITSDHAETFSVDDGIEYTVNHLLFASTAAGTYTITAKSVLYGQNSLTVEVV